jgi:hypothetical protein
MASRRVSGGERKRRGRAARSPPLVFQEPESTIAVLAAHAALSSLAAPLAARQILVHVLVLDILLALARLPAVLAHLVTAGLIGLVLLAFLALAALALLATLVGLAAILLLAAIALLARALAGAFALALVLLLLIALGVCHLSLL